MRKYKMNLTTRSIDNLIDELNDYSNSLDDKVKIFVDRLLEIGVKTAENVPGIPGTFGSHKMENYVSFYKELDVEKDGCHGVMLGVGETFDVTWGERGEKSGSINALLSLEFGTAALAVPKTTKFGATGGKGTNSRYGHQDDAEWYFAIGKDENGMIWKKATAIHPTHPMMKASDEMLRQIKKVAKEVFSK